MHAPPQDKQLQTELTKAELRKLNLEVSSLETQAKLQTATSDLQQQKLELGVKLLKWQNSRIGRLTQFATIFTIAATVVTIAATAFGIWQGYTKFIADRQTERELRAKELRERINIQYRSDLQQLLQYPIDPKQTIPSAIFLFQDLRELIEGTQDADLMKRRGDEVGSLLTNLITSQEYDFRQSRDIEFDLKALDYCSYYSGFLTDHWDDNVTIVSGYFPVLASLHEKDPKYYETIAVDENGNFSGARRLTEQTKLLQFVDLFYGYKKHIELLKKSLQKYPQDAERINAHLNRALCWFYGSTKNSSLARSVFSLDETTLQDRWKRCP